MYHPVYMYNLFCDAAISEQSFSSIPSQAEYLCLLQIYSIIQCEVFYTAPTTPDANSNAFICYVFSVDQSCSAWLQTRQKGATAC